MMPEIRGRNAVLFGAPVDSQVISNVLATTPFTVDYEESAKEFVIRDRANGKLFVPEKGTSGEFRTVFGLITVLNNRESDHGRLGQVVFSGITSVGTHGAAEFFSSVRSLETLRQALGAGKTGAFPAAYQVVVRCTIENMLLVAQDYQTHRVLKR